MLLVAEVFGGKENEIMTSFYSGSNERGLPGGGWGVGRSEGEGFGVVRGRGTRGGDTAERWHVGRSMTPLLCLASGFFLGGGGGSCI